jgi:hypothetical protein
VVIPSPPPKDASGTPLGSNRATKASPPKNPVKFPIPAATIESSDWIAMPTNTAPVPAEIVATPSPPPNVVSSVPSVS